MKIDFEKVLADYGLKAGDKVIIKDYEHNPFTIVKDSSCLSGYVLVDTRDWCTVIDYLFREWEKYIPKKKVGDLICSDVQNGGCGCPLQCIACEGNPYESIRERWTKSLKEYPQLEPMKESIETALNKEVEE